jgi:hypothetical protein
MVRALVAAIIYVITVNHTPVATFDTFRNMNRWVHEYRKMHPSDPNMLEGRVDIYKCTSYDLVGEKCKAYKHSGGI